MKIKTSIIIINWNTENLIRNCINSILENTEYFEIIVVDNGSTDGSVEYLNSLTNIENFKILFNKQNAGFSKANNQGAEIAQGKFLCFLNSDTIVKKGWLNDLYSVFQHISNCGAAGPLGNPAGKIKIQNLYFTYPQFKGQYDKITKVDILSGFCILLSKIIFIEIGGWDEDFLIGNFEDTLLSLKIRFILNKNLAVSPTSDVSHLRPSSTFLKNNIDIQASYIKNKEIFLQKLKQLNIYEKSKKVLPQIL